MLCFEELFTDLTFEFAADAVSGEMPAEIPLARKHLTDTNTFSADMIHLILQYDSLNTNVQVLTPQSAP